MSVNDKQHDSFILPFLRIGESKKEGSVGRSSMFRGWSTLYTNTSISQSTRVIPFSFCEVAFTFENVAENAFSFSEKITKFAKNSSDHGNLDFSVSRAMTACATTTFKTSLCLGEIELG